MKRINLIKLFFVLTGCFHLQIAGAQLNIDSLKHSLEQQPGDSATISRQLDTMKKISTTDPDASIIIGNWVTEKALSGRLYPLYIQGLISIAGIYHYTNDFPTAVEFYKKAQEAADKYGLDEMGLEALNNLANVYYFNNQYDKAEEIYKLTIAECQKRGITIGVAVGYGSLGSLYFSSSGNDAGKKHKAIGYMFSAVQLFESLKDTAQLIQSFSSLSKMYSKIDLFDSAMYYSDKAGLLMTSKKDNQEGYYYYYYHRGIALLGKGNYKEAIETFLTGLPYTRKYNTPLWESSHYEGLSAAYKAIGDFKRSLEYAERHFEIEDSVINTENFAHAADIQNKYEREKKEKELLQKNLALKTESAKRNRVTGWLISSLILLISLFIFASFLVKNIRARKRAYAALEKRNEEIKEQALQLSKQARLIAKFQSQMNPHFTFNALHNIYGLVATNDNEKAVTQIQSLASLMRQTLTNSVKEEITLEEEIAYLKNYIDFEKATSAVNFDFRVEVAGDLQDALIPPMMIQPFIENSVKHAELDKVIKPFVKVMVIKEHDLMKLVIEDNGTGIDTQAGNLGKISHSVSIIRSRIEMLLQGKNAPVYEYFSIHPNKASGKGTIVSFYLPLNYSE